jgi:GNAT superfamily N-acetyltransferase
MILIERLDRARHNRLAFSCGKDQLDRFLHETAAQAFSKNIAATYVAVHPNEPTKILGFYSVSNFQIDAGELPDVISRRFALPNGRLPATLIGRLAVVNEMQGLRLGSHLLIDALIRCALAGEQVASSAIVVDALDENVVPFYEQFGFTRFSEGSRRLFIMMATVRELDIVRLRIAEMRDVNREAI